MAALSPNHAVTIVGWNDSYPASNFASRPPGAGAFIVKNSWGTGWGQQGFFYVSYYDTQFATNSQPPTVFTAEPTTNYNVNYQYDPLGWVTSVGRPNTIFPSNTAWGANVFTATSNQQLSAVSFYAGSLNTQYQVYVYTDPTSGPIGGTEYTGPSGTIAMAWLPYHPAQYDRPAQGWPPVFRCRQDYHPGKQRPHPRGIYSGGLQLGNGATGTGLLECNWDLVDRCNAGRSEYEYLHKGVCKDRRSGQLRRRTRCVRAECKQPRPLYARQRQRRLV